MNRILFVEAAGATIVSRYARLYLRYKGELTEVDPKVRIIVASGFGFVITSDAISVCVKNYVEVIITDAAQSFVGIHAPYAIGLTSRNSLMMRVQQLAAITDKRKGLHVARDIVHRKIMAERHSKSVREGFLVELGKCKSVDHVRHVEARSAQEWWKRWRDFEIKFVKGFKPPEHRLNDGENSKRDT